MTMMHRDLQFVDAKRQPITHRCCPCRYFEKRWAAYPIDRLQAEISLMTGRLERPSTVAEWSRIVFAALEYAAPQWPSM